MAKKLSLLLPIIVLLQACAAGVSPSASPEQVKDAQSLSSHPEYANVYIGIKASGGGVGLSSTISINNEVMGKITAGDYYHIKLVPDTYSFGVTKSGVTGSVTFTYTFKPQDIVLIQCALSYGYSNSEVPNLIGWSKRTNEYVDRPCWFEKNTSEIKSIVEDYDLLMSNKSFISPLGYFEYKRTKQDNSIQAYQTFIDEVPNSPYVQDAQNRVAILKETQRKKNWKELAKKQRCALNYDDWLYIDRSCDGGIANGTGRAVYIDTRHAFEGIIKNGQFVSGKLLLDGEVKFDGEFKDSKPYGMGICLYKGEPEECKYYHGKRVDSLYKQRQEIAQMEKRQQEELQKIRSEISDLKKQQIQTANSGNGNSVGDSLIDKALDKGIEKVFNSLF